MRSASTAPRFVVAVVLFSVAATTNADQSGNARALLSEVAVAYRNLNSFEWTALYTVSTDSGDFKPNTSPLTGEFRRPHSMRIEWNGKNPPANKVSVTNGNDTWLYYRDSRAFCRPNPKLYLDRTPHEAMSTSESSLPYEHILDGVRSLRLVGNRILRIGGADINCIVVTALYVPPKSGWSGVVFTAPITYWIDPSNKIVVQQSYSITPRIPGRTQPRTDTFTMTLTGYRLNPDLPNSRFIFRPPAGSREWPCSSVSGGG